MHNFFLAEDKFTNPFFVAKVEDNNDPTQNYRVKVRIPELHDNISTQDLPWAAKVDASFMGMGTNNDLSHSVPEIGTEVLVLAIGNNPNSLVYLGCLYKKHSNTPAGDAYLGTYGIYRADGQFIGIDKINKLLQMLFTGDINIDKANNLTIKIKQKVNIECNVANIKASKTNIKSEVNITGDTKITGNLTASGTVKFSNYPASVKVTDTGNSSGGSMSSAFGVVTGP